MMSDTLVDRLRGNYIVGPADEFRCRDFSKFVPEIQFEAADRIAELEAQVNRVCECDFVEWDAKDCAALGVKFCHHCGGKIKEVLKEVEVDDD